MPPSSPSLLIDAPTLHTRLQGTAPPIVLDASFELADTDAGRRAFEGGHIPGARYVHLDHDLCGPKTGLNGRHPLPSREHFAATLGRWGLRGSSSPVVVMDRQQSMFAARLWWMLHWMGHEAVQVLDGGWSAWLDAALPVAQGPSPEGLASAPTYPLRPAQHRLTVDAPTLVSALSSTVVVDARAPERFRGDVEPLDPVAGHIPGAVNVPFHRNLRPDGRFQPPDILRQQWTEALGEQVELAVHQCGSGVTACHNVLATVLAGWRPGRLYPGSWSEWCADPTRPVAQGDA